MDDFYRKLLGETAAPVAAAPVAAVNKDPFANLVANLA